MNPASQTRPSKDARPACLAAWSTLEGFGKQTGETTATQARTSLLSANGGDLTLLTGIDPANKGTGTGNIVTQGAHLLAKDKITLTANAIDLQALANESATIERLCDC